MSFESAKKMGFTASIIQLVVPIVAIALLVVFYTFTDSAVFFLQLVAVPLQPTSVWFASAFPLPLYPHSCCFTSWLDTLPNRHAPLIPILQRKSHLQKPTQRPNHTNNQFCCGNGDSIYSDFQLQLAV